MLTRSSGTAAFVVEDFVLDAPDPDKDTRHQCPLCNSVKKLKDMRDHVGRHVLLDSRGVEECDLLKPVSLLPLHYCTLLTHTRLAGTLVDSVVATRATPVSRLLVPNSRSTPTVNFITRSSTTQPRSQRKIPRAPTSQSCAPTARRRFGSTTPLIISCFGTRPFLTMLVSTPS